MHQNTVRQWIKAGKLQCSSLQNETKIARHTIDAILHKIKMETAVISILDLDGLNQVIHLLMEKVNITSEEMNQARMDLEPHITIERMPNPEQWTIRIHRQDIPISYHAKILLNALDQAERSHNCLRCGRPFRLIDWTDIQQKPKAWEILHTMEIQNTVVVCYSVHCKKCKQPTINIRTRSKQ